MWGAVNISSVIIRSTNFTLENVQTHSVQATLVCYVMFYDKMLIWWTSALFALAGRPVLPGYALPTQWQCFLILIMFFKEQSFKSFKHLCFWNNYKIHSLIFKIRITWTKGIYMTFRFGIFFWKKLTVWLPVMVRCDLVYNIICVVCKSLIVIHALKVHVFWEGHKNWTKSPNLIWLTPLNNFK